MFQDRLSWLIVAGSLIATAPSTSAQEAPPPHPQTSKTASPNATRSKSPTASSPNKQSINLKQRHPIEAVSGTDPYSRSVSEIQAGTASLQHNDIKTARRHFEQAIQLDPYNGLSHCCLGVCFERQNHAKFANLEYRIAAMYAKEPGLKQAALNSLERNQKKITAMAQAPLTDPPSADTPMVTQMEDAESASLGGEEELTRGNFDFAMERFIDSLKSDPKNVVANKYLKYQSLARALCDLGAARTKGSVNEGVKFHDYESAVDQLQNLMSNKEVGDEATRAFQSAARQYADLLLRNSQFDHAVSLYTKLVELAPQDAALKDSLFHAIVFSCTQKMDNDDWGNASIGLKLALGVKPNSAEAHFKLGFCLRALGNNKDAFEQFKLAASATDEPGFAQRARDAIQVMAPKE